MKELILEAKSANNYLSENIRKTHKWIAISQDKTSVEYSGQLIFFDSQSVVKVKWLQ